MLLTVPPEQNGVSGAVVEAAQTERAFFFCPNWVAVLAYNGLFRTLASTFIATDTLVFIDNYAHKPFAHVRGTLFIHYVRHVFVLKPL